MPPRHNGLMQTLTHPGRRAVAPAPLDPAGRQAPSRPVPPHTECLTCGHPHAVPHAALGTWSLDGRPGCPECASCRAVLSSPAVPAGLVAAHVMVLACVEDLAWAEAQEVVGLVDVARRFALHVWPVVVPVPPRRAPWADPAWLVEDCLDSGLLEGHRGVAPGPARPLPGTSPMVTGLSLTTTGRGVLDVVTWRPAAD